MRRIDFEHLLRAAADVVDDELVVIGSQAVLGQVPDPPESLMRSVELDVYPRNHRERADQIDAALGDGSPFHEAYDYYAHAVGSETPVAPAGWEGRLIRVDVAAIGARAEPVVAWCMEIHDLVIAKLAAGRPHDLEFTDEAIRSGLVEVEQLRLGVELLPANDRERTRDRLIAAIYRVGL
jgi:uncharacterized nucleotidyltransferase DUF6036